MMHLDIMRSGRISFLSSGEFISTRSSVHPRRTLNHFVLLVGTNGKCRIRHDSREYVLEEGSYLLLFPEKEHAGVAPTEGNQSHFWCHFQIDDPVIAEDSVCGIAEYGRLTSHDKYRLLFKQLIDAEYRKSINEALRRRVCNAYTEIILSEIFFDIEEAQKERRENAEKKGKLLISKVKEWLRLHYREPIGLKSAAIEFGYHPDYLNEVFRKETQKTICAYLKEIRIEKAKKLLLTTDMRIKEIASAVGFEDEHYFMRAFRKEAGVTATKFRNTYFHLHINTDM